MANEMRDALVCILAPRLVGKLGANGREEEELGREGMNYFRFSFLLFLLLPSSPSSDSCEAVRGGAPQGEGGGAGRST